jgi:hypothetical protein
MATRVTSTLIRVVPLLLLAYPSTAQMTTTTTPEDGPVCLNEILISAPNSYDASQVAAAQQKAEGALVAIRQGAKFEDVAKNYSDGPSVCPAIARHYPAEMVSPYSQMGRTEKREARN